MPSKAQMFTFIASEYTNLSLPNGETTMPTLMHKDNKETEVDVSIPYENNTFKVANFKMPGGIAKDLPAGVVPSPMMQVVDWLTFSHRYKGKIPSKGRMQRKYKSISFRSRTVA